MGSRWMKTPIYVVLSHLDPRAGSGEIETVENPVICVTAGSYSALLIMWFAVFSR